MNRPSKLEYAALLAIVAGLRSEDPNTKVGCILLDTNWRVVGTGYNGLPPSVELPEMERDERLKYMIHAEQNAVSACNGVPITAVVTHSPCHSCLSLLVAKGIRQIYFIKRYWRESSDDQAKLFGIKIAPIHLESEVFLGFTDYANELVSANQVGDV